MDVLHGLAVSLFSFLHGALPAAPQIWADAGDALTTVVGLVPAPVLYFVPVGPVLVAGATVLGIIVAVGLLRLARRVLSLFTGGGGMA